MLKLQVRKEFPYNKIGSFRKVNPFCLAFVYPESSKDDPFIIKGGLNDIEKFLSEYPFPFIAYYSLWYHKKQRGYWKSNIKYLIITRNFKKVNGKSFLFEGFVITFKRKIIKKLNRVPRKWIKELDHLNLELMENDKYKSY